MNSILYFAYGSNLDVDQVRGRLGRPALHPVVKAELRGWSFAFNKHSDDGSDKANIVADPSGRVLGCLYDLTSAELDTLAAYEKGYAVINVEVSPGAERRAAKTFVAKRERLCSLGCGPAKEYLDRIINGARAVGIDEAYISQIRSVGKRRPVTLGTRSSRLTTRTISRLRRRKPARKAKRDR